MLVQLAGASAGTLTSTLFLSLADQPSSPASAGGALRPTFCPVCHFLPSHPRGGVRRDCLPGAWKGGVPSACLASPVLPAARPFRGPRAPEEWPSCAHLGDEGVPGHRSHGAPWLKEANPLVSRSSSVWSSALAARLPRGGEGRGQRPRSRLGAGGMREASPGRPVERDLVDQKLLACRVVPGREFLERPCVQSSEAGQQLHGAGRGSGEHPLSPVAPSARSSFPLEEASALGHLAWGPGRVHLPFCFHHWPVWLSRGLSRGLWSAGQQWFLSGTPERRQVGDARHLPPGRRASQPNGAASP